MRWALLLAFGLLLSCGTKPPPCDRTSYTIGCCDSRGLCVSGLSDSACGERGAACESCPSSSICQAGRCGSLSGAGGGAPGGVDAGAVDAGVQLGSACAQAGFFCFSASTALECVNRTWRGLPCRGPMGCATDGGTTSCDMNGNLEADACASSAEGKGLCTADGGGTLECRSGVLVKTNTCRTCMISGDVVICQP